VSIPLTPPPRPPLPADLQRRLSILLAKPALVRFPRLGEAITALVLDAWCRQPVPETVAVTTRQLAETGRVTQETPDWTRQQWPGKLP